MFMYVENSTQVTVMMFHMAHPCDKFLTSLISGLTFGFVGSTAGRSKSRLMVNAFSEVYSGYRVQRISGVFILFAFQVNVFQTLHKSL